MKKVHGFFVLVIKQFDDTMHGADYHYTPWCIAKQKYCRYTNPEKIKKFETYNAAKEYAAKTASSHDRTYEVAYLTTQSYIQDSSNTALLTHWVKIANEKDAIAFDTRCKKHGEAVASQHNDIPWWNNKEFDAVYNRKRQ